MEQDDQRGALSLLRRGGTIDVARPLEAPRLDRLFPDRLPGFRRGGREEKNIRQRHETETSSKRDDHEPLLSGHRLGAGINRIQTPYGIVTKKTSVVA